MGARIGNQDGDEFVTSEGAAILLKCSLPTIRRMVASGKLPFVRLGRLVRFRRSDVLSAAG